MDAVILCLVAGGLGLVLWALCPLMWAPPGKRFSNRKSNSYVLGGLLLLAAAWLGHVPNEGLLTVAVLIGIGLLAIVFCRRREEVTLARQGQEAFAKQRMRDETVPRSYLTPEQATDMEPAVLEAWFGQEADLATVPERER